MRNLTVANSDALRYSFFVVVVTYQNSQHILFLNSENNKNKFSLFSLYKVFL